MDYIRRKAYMLEDVYVRVDIYTGGLKSEMDVLLEPK